MEATWVPWLVSNRYGCRTLISDSHADNKPGRHTDNDKQVPIVVDIDADIDVIFLAEPAELSGLPIDPQDKGGRQFTTLTNVYSGSPPAADGGVR